MNARNCPTIPPTPLSVAARIARLPELPMPEVKALWQKLFGADTPNANRAFLERRIAYKLQEIEFRTVDADLLERNQRRIASLLEAGKVKKRDGDTRLAAGTVLTREYRDVEYCVVATADGQYEFNGRMYPSLSMIAREITGTRWSGPLFFGLKAPAKPETSVRKGTRR
jgi:hypothetical protein